MGIEFGLYSLDHETTKTIGEEAKSMLESVDMMTFSIEEFGKMDALIHKYAKHKNWRIRN